MGGANNIAWTPERDEACKVWLAAGFSRSQTAVKLNDKFQTRFTRCAVGGRAWRLKFISPERPKLGRKPRVYKYVPRHGRSSAPKLPVTMECIEIAPLNVELLKLDDDGCRYPSAGDGRGYPGYLFCGHEQVEGSPYCLEHTALSIRPAQWGGR